MEEEIVPRSTQWLILHMKLPIGQILKGLGKTHSGSKCQLLAFQSVGQPATSETEKGTDVI